MPTNPYAAHDYISQVRGYTRFHPRESDRLAHMLGALGLHLDVLERSEEKHSITANVSRDLREHVKDVAAFFRVTPSEFVRFSLMAALEHVSGLDGAPELTDELRFNSR